MPPKKTQVFAGKRKSNKNNGPQMKKGKKASLPPQGEDSNGSGEDDEAEFIKASVAKQLNGGSDPSSEDSEPINQKPQRVAGKQSARKKKTQAKVTAPESNDDESDEDDGEAENDSDDEDQEEDVAPRGAKLKKPNKVVKQQAKPKAGSSEDDDDDDDEIDEDDDDGGIDEDDDEDDLSMGSEGDDDLEFDEDGDEETAGPDMESDPESEDEPVEVSSKKSSITAARKKQAKSDSDDEDETLALPSSKPGKPKHKKLGSESDDGSEDEQEESPQKKKLKAAKADEKQIDEKLEEIFDSYKTTEAEVEQFRKNYVTMVRSWLFIPRVPVGATAEEIKGLHPKITKVKLPTKTKDKSFAFLNFASTRDADEVLKELSKQTCVVAGEPVKIQKAREFGMTPPAYINRRKLAIIACPKETTQEELCRLFPQATTVWLSKNARTDTVENYLSFPDEDTAREALAENGTVSLHGKCCALFFDNYSYKKKTAGRKLKKKLGAGKAVDVDKITPDAPKRPKKFSKRDEDQSRNGRSFSSNLTEDRVDKEDGFRSNFRGGSRGGHGGFRGKDRDTFQPRGRGSFGRGRGGSDRGGRGGFSRGGGGRGGFDRGDRGSSDRGGRGGFDRGGRGGFGRGGRGGSSRGRGGFDRGGRGGFDRGGRGGFDRGGRGGFNRGGRGGSDRGGRGSFGRGGGRGGFNRSNRTEMD